MVPTMSACCCAPRPSSADPRFRRALWIALLVNAAMFAAELAASWSSGSVSLMADSIDFLGDAANYALSIAVLSMATRVRARAAVVKASCMVAFGVVVLVRAFWSWQAGETPEPLTMGVTAMLALAANLGVAWMLYRFRDGDANMRSVWICSRNDAIGNVAVALAAFGVFGTGTSWPDLLVATLMAILAISGATTVWRHARGEFRAVAG